MRDRETVLAMPGERFFGFETAKSEGLLRSREVGHLEMALSLEISRDSEFAVRNNTFLSSACGRGFQGLGSGPLNPAEYAGVPSSEPCGGSRGTGSHQRPAV